MASQQENDESYLKLVQIYNSFQEIYPTKRLVENILKKKGDVNYKIPLKSCVAEPKLIGCTALQIAVMKNETETAVILLRNGADFAVQDQNGRTALHYAFDHQSPEEDLIDIMLSKHLLSAITNNPCDANGLSHFHIACLYNHADAVKHFLSNGISVDMAISSDAKRFAGYTPLHFAAEGAAAAVIRILFGSNARINVKNARGLTPLHVLLEKKIKLFDFHNANDEKVPNDGITTAIEDAMDLLLDIDDVDEIGLTQFHIACTQRDVSLVEYYLKQNNVDINKAVRMDSPIYPGYTPMHFAAHCNLDIVKELLKKNANFEARDANGVTSMDLLWKIHKGKDLCRIFEPNWNYLTFTDGETRLLDFMKFAHEAELMESYLGRVRDLTATMNAGASFWKGRTFLHFAVMLRDSIETIKLCKGLSNSLNVQDFSGFTPIHLAFRLNKPDVADILMKKCNTFQNVIDTENLSHLHIACALQNYEKVHEACFINKFDEPYRGKMTYGWVTPGSTALHVAMASGNKEIIAKLLEHGFNIEAKNDNGETPLDLFLRLDGKKVIPVCRLLLLWNSAVTDDMLERIGLTRLHIAMYCIGYGNTCAYVNEKDIKAVIKSHDSLSFVHDYEGCTPLQMAIMRYVNKAIVQTLINNNSDLLVKNHQGNSALYLALSQRSDWEGVNVIVETLLHNRTLRRELEEMSGITMLHIACYTANFTAVSWALTGIANVDTRVRSDCPIWADCTPLHVLMKTVTYRAATDDFLKILKLLINDGANVTAKDGNNETPIHLSMRNFYTEQNRLAVKFLIKSLSVHDTNPVDRNGMSHFHAACLVNNTKAAKLFIQNAVDVNQRVDNFAKDFAGQTPLHLAVSWNTSCECKRGIIDMLLANGADIKAEDSFGQTALHKAIQLSYSMHILEMLVPRGIAIDCRDIFERTPLELLMQSKSVTLDKIQLFEKYGCRLNDSNPLSEEGYISELISMNYHPNDTSSDQSLSEKRKKIRSPKKENKRRYTLLVDTNTMEMSSPCDTVNTCATVAQCFNALLKNINWYTLDDQGRNLIHNSVTTDKPNCKIVKYDHLISSFQFAGFDIDVRDKNGKTALHLAAQFGNVPAVNALLNKGADVNILDGANMTPLNYAMRFHDTNNEIIMCLVQHVCRLLQLELEVNPNNIWQREEFWNFVSKEERKLILQRVRSYELIDYRPKIEGKWFTLVNEHPKLILGDFLSETGKGLTLYSFMSDLRDRVDKFFRSYNYGLKDVCQLQYRKAVKRISLVELAADSLLAIAGSNVPIEIIEIIFQYLTNSDLNNFIKGTAAEPNVVTTDSRS